MRSRGLLNTTSFALLAQIARQPISAYGLTLLMRHNLHYFWPRAESRIYAEVHRLEAGGLVRATEKSVGRRARRVMRVTPQGRDSLRGWLEGPVRPGIALESEALVRVFFATLGSVPDLRRALAQVQTEAAEMLAIAADIGDAYGSGKGTAPEQAHVRAMMHELLASYAQLLRDWSTDHLHRIESWRDLTPAGKRQPALARFRTTTARINRQRRAGQPPRESA